MSRAIRRHHRARKIAKFRAALPFIQYKHVCMMARSGKLCRKYCCANPRKAAGNSRTALPLQVLKAPVVCFEE